MATTAPRKSPTQKKAESDAIFLFWGVSNTIAFLHILLTGSNAGVFARAYRLSFFLGSLSISVAFVFLFGSFATDSMDMKSVCLAFLKGSFIILIVTGIGLSVLSWLA